MRMFLGLMSILWLTIAAALLLNNQGTVVHELMAALLASFALVMVALSSVIEALHLMRRANVYHLAKLRDGERTHRYRGLYGMDLDPPDETDRQVEALNATARRMRSSIPVLMVGDDPGDECTCDQCTGGSKKRGWWL